MTRDPGIKRRSHVIGFALALFLTLVPFAAVFYDMLARTQAFALISLCAVLQILVQMRFFLGIQFGETQPARLIMLGFTAVLIFVMVGGTFWIIGGLNSRMMP